MEHFGSAAAERAHREPLCFTAAALDALRAYGWPGNVREVRDLVELVVFMSPHGIVSADELPTEMRRDDVQPADPGPGTPNLRSIERAAIAAAVHACGGNVTRAAKRLSIARSTLHRRLAAFEPMR